MIEWKERAKNIESRASIQKETAGEESVKFDNVGSGFKQQYGKICLDKEKGHMNRKFSRLLRWQH